MQYAIYTGIYVAFEISLGILAGKLLRYRRREAAPRYFEYFVAAGNGLRLAKFEKPAPLAQGSPVPCA